MCHRPRATWCSPVTRGVRAAPRQGCGLKREISSGVRAPLRTPPRGWPPPAQRAASHRGRWGGWDRTTRCPRSWQPCAAGFEGGNTAWMARRARRAQAASRRAPGRLFASPVRPPPSLRAYLDSASLLGGALLGLDPHRVRTGEHHGCCCWGRRGVLMRVQMAENEACDNVFGEHLGRGRASRGHRCSRQPKPKRRQWPGEARQGPHRGMTTVKQWQCSISSCHGTPIAGLLQPRALNA